MKGMTGEPGTTNFNTSPGTNTNTIIERPIEPVVTKGYKYPVPSIPFNF